MILPEEIRYVTNADGNRTAVLLPIEIWREFSSELETAYLLRSETMNGAFSKHGRGRVESPSMKSARRLGFNCRLRDSHLD